MSPGDSGYDQLIELGLLGCFPTVFLGHRLVRNPSRSLWNIKEIAYDW